MKKKIIQIEIECADDGVHCGKCDWNDPHCTSNTEVEPSQCVLFQVDYKRPQLENDIEGDLRCPACIASEVANSTSPTLGISMVRNELKSILSASNIRLATEKFYEIISDYDVRYAKWQDSQHLGVSSTDVISQSAKPDPCIYSSFKKGNCAPCSAVCEPRNGFVNAKPDLSAPVVNGLIPNNAGERIQGFIDDLPAEVKPLELSALKEKLKAQTDEMVLYCKRYAPEPDRYSAVDIDRIIRAIDEVETTVGTAPVYKKPLDSLKEKIKADMAEEHMAVLNDNDGMFARERNSVREDILEYIAEYEKERE